MLMLSEGHIDLVRDRGTVLGRGLIGALFFVSGLSMLSNPGGSAMYLESMNVPVAALAVWLVIIVKVAAGGAIIWGKRVPEAAAALIVFTGLATLFGHFNPFDLIAVMKNLAIIGGLLYLMAYGPDGTNTTKLAQS